uniref:Radial spoke protein 3 n=1 Tax=Alexandrium catenella TaxID=2925 RepID=A0A7S1RFT0_ALECA
MHTGEVQQFASAPQAVGARKKYRDPNDIPGANNIMHDRRVVRGNTYASMVQPQPDMADVQKQREAQRRRLMRANKTTKRAGTPDPVPGRKHMDIQTDSYLEELTERTVEFEAETQTDFLLDRPPSPLFMPAKIGCDVETQIEDGELFDFDMECEPVLEVLVGKTLEQGMMEVLEEEELESLRRHQEDFEKRRNAELLEVQRMEAAEKRRQEEMQRRLQQQASQREQDLSIMRKVVSRSIAAAHLSSLKDRALAHLLDAGIFADAVQLAVDNHFMPQLLQLVTEQMDQSRADRQIFGGVIQSTAQQRLEKQERVLEVERRRIAAIDDAERQARIEIAAQRARREKEAQRVLEEQAGLVEWEEKEPPAPEEQPEFQVVEVKDEDGTTQAVFADGSAVPVPPEKLEELKQALESLTDGQTVMAKVASVPAEGDDGVASSVLESFRVATPEESAPADGAADPEAA